MIIRLRHTTPADLAWVTDLERVHEGRIGQWTDSQHLEAMRMPDCEHRVMEIAGGEPLGYLIAYDTAAATGGIYLKRILVADKGLGTGTAVMRSWLEKVFARADVRFVWLNVFNVNDGAQVLYGRLGFARWDPSEEECRLCDEAAEPPAPTAIRMRLDRLSYEALRQPDAGHPT
jgi:ribosomal protein S18 acetylase RimI-like enzyme